MTSLTKEQTIIRDAARWAAFLCLAVRHEMLDQLHSMEKAGREPVTIADYGSQALVLQAIAKYFPNDGSIAEERAGEFDKLASDAQRHKVTHYVGETLKRNVSLDDVRCWLDWGRDRLGERIWVVDPIDGTKGFLRGDQFAVAVALIIDGQPVLGALACPLLPIDPAQPDGERGVLALAQRGHGATIEALHGGLSRSLCVSSQSDASQARMLESVESGHTDHDFSAQLLAAIGGGGQPVRMDSQAKYAALADGRAEVYLRQSPGEGYTEKVWDHAAGALIVEEAGGQVTDLDGRPLDFSHGARLAANRGILATNGLVHDALLESVRQVV
ncbi:MAG: 3'(2'),5'-bisphosphate nucleotidase [Anaerolineae bacterium]|nr:3'(2'),5'-bisphosphate nucleotidase [Anaerolineae bacterium]